MKFRLEWNLRHGEKLWRTKNFIPAEGEESWLQIMMQGNNILVPASGNFYVGLCEESPAQDDTLATITTEPTSQGGYARQPITRDTTGFPTIFTAANGHKAARSLLISFGASGADYSRTFTRLFLTNVLSGTEGKLLAYSGPLTEPLLITDGGTPFEAAFNMFVD